MSWAKALAGCALLAAAAAAAVYAATPPTPSSITWFRVKPTSLPRGGRVTFSGGGGPCHYGDRAILYSALFPGGRKGELLGAIVTSVRQGEWFSRRFRVPQQTRPRRYVITAICNGKNLGIAVHLRVR